MSMNLNDEAIRLELLIKLSEADLKRLAGEREKARDTMDRMEMVLQRVARQEKETKQQLNTALAQQQGPK